MLVDREWHSVVAACPFHPAEEHALLPGTLGVTCIKNQPTAVPPELQVFDSTFENKRAIQLNFRRQPRPLNSTIAKSDAARKHCQIRSQTRQCSILVLTSFWVWLMDR